MNEAAISQLQLVLERRFPLGIPRQRLDEATGGILKGRTESNNDSLGCGIQGRFMIGNKVIYPVHGVIARIRNKIRPVISK